MYGGGEEGGEGEEGGQEGGSGELHSGGRELLMSAAMVYYWDLSAISS